MFLITSTRNFYAFLLFVDQSMWWIKKFFMINEVKNISLHLIWKYTTEQVLNHLEKNLIWLISMISLNIFLGTQKTGFDSTSKYAFFYLKINLPQSWIFWPYNSSDCQIVKKFNAALSETGKISMYFMFI